MAVLDRIKGGIERSLQGTGGGGQPSGGGGGGEQPPTTPGSPIDQLNNLINKALSGAGALFGGAFGGGQPSGGGGFGGGIGFGERTLGQAMREAGVSRTGAEAKAGGSWLDTTPRAEGRSWASLRYSQGPERWGLPGPKPGAEVRVGAPTTTTPGVQARPSAGVGYVPTITGEGNMPRSDQYRYIPPKELATGYGAGGPLQIVPLVGPTGGWGTGLWEGPAQLTLAAKTEVEKFAKEVLGEEEYERLGKVRTPADVARSTIDVLSVAAAAAGRVLNPLSPVFNFLDAEARLPGAAAGALVGAGEQLVQGGDVGAGARAGWAAGELAYSQALHPVAGLTERAVKSMMPESPEEAIAAAAWGPFWPSAVAMYHTGKKLAEKGPKGYLAEYLAPLAEMGSYTPYREAKDRILSGENAQQVLESIPKDPVADMIGMVVADPLNFVGMAGGMAAARRAENIAREGALSARFITQAAKADDVVQVSQKIADTTIEVAKQAKLWETINTGNTTAAAKVLKSLDLVKDESEGVQLAQRLQGHTPDMLDEALRAMAIGSASGQQAIKTATVQKAFDNAAADMAEMGRKYSPLIPWARTPQANVSLIGEQASDVIGSTMAGADELTRVAYKRPEVLNMARSDSPIARVLSQAIAEGKSPDEAKTLVLEEALKLLPTDPTQLSILLGPRRAMADDTIRTGAIIRQVLTNDAGQFELGKIGRIMANSKTRGEAVGELASLMRKATLGFFPEPKLPGIVTAPAKFARAVNSALAQLFLGWNPSYPLRNFITDTTIRIIDLGPSAYFSPVDMYRVLDRFGMPVTAAERGTAGAMSAIVSPTTKSIGPFGKLAQKVEIFNSKASIADVIKKMMPKMMKQNLDNAPPNLWAMLTPEQSQALRGALTNTMNTDEAAEAIRRVLLGEAKTPLPSDLYEKLFRLDPDTAAEVQRVLLDPTLTPNEQLAALDNIAARVQTHAQFMRPQLQNLYTLDQDKALIDALQQQGLDAATIDQMLKSLHGFATNYNQARMGIDTAKNAVQQSIIDTVQAMAKSGNPLQASLTHQAFLADFKATFDQAEQILATAGQQVDAMRAATWQIHHANPAQRDVIWPAYFKFRDDTWTKAFNETNKLYDDLMARITNNTPLTGAQVRAGLPRTGPPAAAPAQAGPPPAAAPSAAAVAPSPAAAAQPPPAAAPAQVAAPPAAATAPVVPQQPTAAVQVDALQALLADTSLDYVAIQRKEAAVFAPTKATGVRSNQAVRNAWRKNVGDTPYPTTQRAWEARPEAERAAWAKYLDAKLEDKLDKLQQQAASALPPQPPTAAAPAQAGLPAGVAAAPPPATAVQPPPAAAAPAGAPQPAAALPPPQPPPAAAASAATTAAPPPRPAAAAQFDEVEARTLIQQGKNLPPASAAELANVSAKETQLMRFDQLEDFWRANISDKYDYPYFSRDWEQLPDALRDKYIKKLDELLEKKIRGEDIDLNLPERPPRQTAEQAAIQAAAQQLPPPPPDIQQVARDVADSKPVAILPEAQPAPQLPEPVEAAIPPREIVEEARQARPEYVPPKSVVREVEEKVTGPEANWLDKVVNVRSRLRRNKAKLNAAAAQTMSETLTQLGHAVEPDDILTLCGENVSFAGRNTFAEAMGDVVAAIERNENWANEGMGEAKALRREFERIVAGLDFSDFDKAVENELKAQTAFVETLGSRVNKQAVYERLNEVLRPAAEQAVARRMGENIMGVGGGKPSLKAIQETMNNYATHLNESINSCQRRLNLLDAVEDLQPPGFNAAAVDKARQAIRETQRTYTEWLDKASKAMDAIHQNAAKLDSVLNNKPSVRAYAETMLDYALLRKTAVKELPQKLHLITLDGQPAFSDGFLMEAVPDEWVLTRAGKSVERSDVALTSQNFTDARRAKPIGALPGKYDEGLPIVMASIDKKKHIVVDSGRYGRVVHDYPDSNAFIAAMPNPRQPDAPPVDVLVFKSKNRVVGVIGQRVIPEDSEAARYLSDLIAAYQGKPLPYDEWQRRALGMAAEPSVKSPRELWQMPDQLITVGREAPQPGQAKAAFKKLLDMGELKPGTVNMDIGGGRSNLATEFLEQSGVTNVVYDPFSRTVEENANAVLRAGFGQSDTVTINNVLNVIPEEANQRLVLMQSDNALKPGGKVYITVNEGDGSGLAKISAAGFEHNKPAEEYVDLVRQYFDNVQVRDNVIIGTRKPEGEWRYGGLRERGLARAGGGGAAVPGAEGAIAGAGPEPYSNVTRVGGYDRLPDDFKPHFSEIFSALPQAEQDFILERGLYYAYAAPEELMAESPRLNLLQAAAMCAPSDGIVIVNASNIFNSKTLAKTIEHENIHAAWHYVDDAVKNDIADDLGRRLFDFYAAARTDPITRDYVAYLEQTFSSLPRSAPGTGEASDRLRVLLFDGEAVNPRVEGRLTELAQRAGLNLGEGSEFYAVNAARITAAYNAGPAGYEDVLEYALEELLTEHVAGSEMATRLFESAIRQYTALPVEARPRAGIKPHWLPRKLKQYAQNNAPGSVPGNLLAGTYIRQNGLDDVFDAIRNHILNSKPLTRDERAYMAWMEYLGTQLAPQMNETKSIVARYASAARDFAMHNYQDKRNFDVVMGLMFPWSFWYTRTVPKFGVRFATRPYLLANYNRLMETMDRINQDLPEFYRRNIMLNLPFLDDPVMLNIRTAVDPLYQLVEDFHDVERERTPVGRFLANMQNLGLSVFAPVVWGYALERYLTGHPVEAEAWMSNYFSPQTRALKYGSALLGARGGKGITAEPWMWPGLGEALKGSLLEGKNKWANVEWFGGETKWDTRKVPMMLVQLSKEGKIDPKQMAIAARTRSGRAWDMAVAQTMRTYGPAALVSLAIGAGFKGRFPTEVELERAYDEYFKLWENAPDLDKEGPERDAFFELLNRFERKYPWFEYVQIARKGYDYDRDFSFSKNILSRLPPGQMYKALESVGISEELLDKFRKSRDLLYKKRSQMPPGSVPLNVFEGWTDKEVDTWMNGIMKLAEIWPVPSAKELDEWDRLWEANSQKEIEAKRLFGDDIMDVMRQYWDLPPASEERRAYRKANPRIDSYYDWLEEYEARAGLTGMFRDQPAGPTTRFVYDTRNVPESIRRYQDKIRTYALEYDVPEALIYGVIQIESRGDPYARNPTFPAIGLMGVVSSEAFPDRPTTEQLYDAETNIAWGVKILREKLNAANGDVEKATYLYSGGDNWTSYDRFIEKYWTPLNMAIKKMFPSSGESTNWVYELRREIFGDDIDDQIERAMELRETQGNVAFRNFLAANPRVGDALDWTRLMKASGVTGGQPQGGQAAVPGAAPAQPGTWLTTPTGGRQPWYEGLRNLPPPQPTTTRTYGSLGSGRGRRQAQPQRQGQYYYNGQWWDWPWWLFPQKKWYPFHWRW